MLCLYGDTVPRTVRTGLSKYDTTTDITQEVNLPEDSPSPGECFLKWLEMIIIPIYF